MNHSSKKGTWMPRIDLDSLGCYAIHQDGSLAPDAPPLTPVAQKAKESAVQLYQSQGFVEPWIGYLVVSDNNWVGTFCFQGPPKESEEESEIEIYCSTFDSYQGQGVGKMMIQEMILIVQQVYPKLVIVARTESDSDRACHLLQNFGFRFAGKREQSENGENLRWERPAALPLI